MWRWGAVTVVIAACASGNKETKATEPCEGPAAVCGEPATEGDPAEAGDDTVHAREISLEDKRRLAEMFVAQAEQTGDPDAYYNAAVFLEADDPNRALALIAKALERDPRHALSLFFLACHHAKTGDLDGAFGYLEKSADAGYDDEPSASATTCLERARLDPRWPPIVERFRRNSGSQP